MSDEKVRSTFSFMEFIHVVSIDKNDRHEPPKSSGGYEINAPIVGATAVAPTSAMHALKNTVAVDHSLLARVENKLVCEG